MNRHAEAAVLSACMVLAPVFAFIACAGGAARTNSLLPALSQAWASIRVQCMREHDAAPNPAVKVAIADADGAIVRGDIVAFLSVDWKLLDATAEADIKRRLLDATIGPLTAESLRGRLAEFAESRALYTQRPAQ